MINLNIKRRCIIYVLLLIPFFELYSFDMLAGRNVFPLFFKVLTTLLSLCRVCITAFMAADFLYHRRLPAMITTWGFGFYCLACIITSYMNGSLYINYVVGNITYIGLALLCERMMRTSMEDFHKACILLFGFYSIVGALTIFVFPNGFFHAATKAEAVYFLGSKNSSFYYFLIFLFFLFYHALGRKEKLPRFGGIISMVLLLAVLVCDSSNSFLCLFVVFAYYMVLKYGYKLYRLANARLLFLLGIFLTLFIIFSANHELIKTIVNMVGRDTSYSGRDTLWEQALEMFVEHPFIGNGIFSEFQLKSGVWASHAHNLYLDIMAKYGVFPLLILIGTIVLIISSFSKTKNRRLANLAGVCLFTILLHNIFDDIAIYVLVLLFISFETAPYKEPVEKESTAPYWRLQQL